MLPPTEILIKEYNYNLPDSAIAKHPLEGRDDSKLLVYKNGFIEESDYRNLTAFLPPESILIFNNTKVTEARLLFIKDAGSVIELFCLEAADELADMAAALLQKKTVQWKCFVGGAKKWKAETLQISRDYREEKITLTAKKIEKKADYFVVEFTWNNDAINFADILHLFGNIPLPPYLHRTAEEADKERYQTVYAQHIGSVAAPTAGLHFTDELFKKLADKKIKKSFVTLHVGAGTFKPVKADTIGGHEMHAEFIEVSIELIEQLHKHLPKTIIAVGTTSLRTIESLYWIGVKIIMDKNITPENINLSQWEAYALSQHIAASEALNTLLFWMKNNAIKTIKAKTKILIAPGYQLKIANALITNFHQPQSTLLLLIAAIVGDDWKKIYAYALANNFRFLSYGDGCLLWNKMG